MSARVVDRAHFGCLFDILEGRGFTVVGPTLRDGAIVYDRLSGVEDLPEGWTDRQDAGTYRVERRNDMALFGYNVGPQSWKRYLFPPQTTLLHVRRTNGTLAFSQHDLEEVRYAFVGVRACELAAMEIQGRVFNGNGEVDRTYAATSGAAVRIAVNCAVAGGTCFCASMETGPRCSTGYDIVVTEVVEEGRHDFILEAGTDLGSELLGEMPGRLARGPDLDHVADIVARTEARMGREMDTAGVRDLLVGAAEDQRWEQIAQRCLACSNCTMVCPTCFCSTTEDRVDLDGTGAVRVRRWDSCFSLGFSELHGFPVRASVGARYRQWITHKLGTWIDQFGTSGCVGCGRCITFCPVGIDITKEVAALRAESEALT